MPSNSSSYSGSNWGSFFHTSKGYSQTNGLGDQLTLRESLAFHFPYDQKRKNFPSFIWQTWKNVPDDNEFEDKFRRLEASWTEKNRGMVHEVITDKVADALMLHYYSPIPQVLQAWKAMPIPVLKADFFRYLILLARGGIYSDIDTEALKPATAWIPKPLSPADVGVIIGIEADPDRSDWHDWYSRRVQFCQWTFRAKPGHPLFREIVARITEQTLERTNNGSISGLMTAASHGSKSAISEIVEKHVMEWTGPAIWTDSVFDYLNSKSVLETFKENGEYGISWHNFTDMRETKLIGDILVLPITGK